MKIYKSRVDTAIGLAYIPQKSFLAGQFIRNFIQLFSPRLQDGNLQFC
jgi:hypothetical protein